MTEFYSYSGLILFRVITAIGNFSALYRGVRVTVERIGRNGDSTILVKESK